MEEHNIGVATTADWTAPDTNTPDPHARRQRRPTHLPCADAVGSQRGPSGLIRGDMRRLTPSLWIRAALTTAAAGCLLTTTSGCSLQKLTADQSASLMAAGSPALNRESDLQFAREAFPASLKTMEVFLLNTPENSELLLLLAQGYSSYAFAFIEGDLEAAQLQGTEEEVQDLTRRAVLHYMRGRTYGFMLLDFEKLRDAALAGDLTRTRELLRNTDKEDVPGLFWSAYGWISAINLSQDNPDMVAALPIVEAIINRVIALDPDYMGGLPHIMMGVYHASRPPMFGGKPEEARKHFEIAMKRHGNANLLAPFMFGRFYAPHSQDRALFNKMMAQVLDAKVEDYPDMRLNNEVARQRARFWTANADEIFFE